MTYSEIILYEISQGRNTIRAISESQRTMMLHDLRSAIARMLYAGVIVSNGSGKYSIPDDDPNRPPSAAKRRRIKRRVEMLIKNECGVGFSLVSDCLPTVAADKVSSAITKTKGA